MKDPIPPPPAWLSQAVQPFADYWHLDTLPLHIHEVIAAFSAYTFINLVVAPWISNKIVPEKYAKLSKSRKINWNVHVVSLCQSTLINVLALWVMWTDNERYNMDWEQRIWGYTGGCGLIQGLATGYFLWDLMITLQNVQLFGVGMLAHAVCALLVFSLGFRPFVNFYGPTFILYELSSPFLNFHWFFDKLDMTGSRAQLYNGIVLLVVFFCCRLVWGTYQSLRVYQDIWRSLHHAPGSYMASKNLDGTVENIPEGMMQFAGEEFIPVWMALAYFGSNIILNTLNFYWFSKMIDTVRKRFQPAKEPIKQEAFAVKTTGADGKATIEVDGVEVRKRTVDAISGDVLKEVPSVI